jgi:hypothetical protein
MLSDSEGSELIVLSASRQSFGIYLSKRDFEQKTVIA